MPIPTRRCSAIVTTVPKLPPVRKTSMPELPLRMAELQELETVREEQCSFLAEPAGVVRLEPRDMDIFYAEPVISEPPSVAKAPPPRMQKNDCKKHSKCHCALFSQKIEGFFDV